MQANACHILSYYSAKYCCAISEYLWYTKNTSNECLLKMEVYLIWQTKHLPAETVGRISCSPRVNKTFMLKKALRMSLSVAPDAELQGRASRAAAGAGIPIVKCFPLYVPSAAKKPWFLSGLPTTSLYIAGTVSSLKNGQGTGINKQSRLTAGFFVQFFEERLGRQTH